ncbi:MAG: glycosyltransferase family 4 protein [Actinobacteria bacterium]|nr:glycosyltransferase family 4 protein [Actinomycetota bacterium]
MYPRFSETFVLSEILAHEAAGTDLEIFSLRPPADGRFHEALAEVRASVTYLHHHGRRSGDLWDLLRTGAAELPGLALNLHELLAADVEDGAQAVELALLAQARGVGHFHAHFASVATTVARLASMLTGIPYSFTAHAKDIFHEEVDPVDFRHKLEGTVAAVTVSDFNLAHLRSCHGAAASTAVRVYNGLDLERFPYAAPTLRPPLVVGVGRLVAKKGFVDLVDACALLVERGRKFRCQIVGGGPEHQALCRRIAEHRLADTVILSGPLPQSGVRSLVAGAAVLAAPCVVAADGNRDGLPTVLLEAMALGTPCVTTPVTGIPEAIRHGLTGLVVDEHDPEALAAAIEQLLDDSELRVRLAGSARALIEEEFDVHRQAARLRRHFAPAPAPAAGLTPAQACG